MATTLAQLIGILPKHYGSSATAVKVFPELTFIKRQDQSGEDTQVKSLSARGRKGQVYLPHALCFVVGVVFS